MRGMKRLSAQLVLMAVLLAVSASALTLAVGCAKTVDAAEAEVVRNYAKGLPAVLAAQTLDGIRPYATPDHVDKMRLYVVMQTEERKVRVQARLISQEIVSTTTTGENQAEVVAAEHWSVVEYQRDTGDVASRKDEKSTATYSLYRAQGVWRVDDVVTK